jgi:hypothetical protein
VHMSLGSLVYQTTKVTSTRLLLSLLLWWECIVCQSCESLSCICGSIDCQVSCRVQCASAPSVGADRRGQLQNDPLSLLAPQSTGGKNGRVHFAVVAVEGEGERIPMKKVGGA